MAATNSEQRVEATDHPLTSLGRQTSIYSLTLGEVHHAIGDSGRDFGSMNMDDFLNSVWTAEEGPQNDAVPTLPPPLSRKTVDEVWSAIQRGGGSSGGGGPTAGPENEQRQQTFGEITLEDFLIKAGVVREQGPARPVPGPIMGGGGGVPVGVDPPAYVGGAERNTAVGCYGGPGGGYGPGSAVQGYGYGPGLGLGMGLRVGRVGPEGVGGGGGGVDGSEVRGRNRTGDGPVEKVVERRQKRMIKNRESAARSRARKQAYSVELEAELNQLKDENTQLKQDLEEIKRRRYQQLLEEQHKMQQKRMQKTQQKLELAKMRSNSCPM